MKRRGRHPAAAWRKVTRWLPLLLVGLLLAVLLSRERFSTREIHWDEATLRQALQPEIAQLQVLVRDPQLLAAVRQQNAAGLSLAEIQRRDQRWRSTGRSVS